MRCLSQLDITFFLTPYHHFITFHFITFCPTIFFSEWYYIVLHMIRIFHQLQLLLQLQFRPEPQPQFSLYLKGDF